MYTFLSVNALSLILCLFNKTAMFGSPLRQ